MKKIIAYILIIIVFASNICTNTLIVKGEIEQETNFVENDILQSAKSYASSYYLEMVQIVKDMEEEFQVNISDIKNVTLGDPYYIYDADSFIQNPEIFFPVYDGDKIILVLSVVYAENKWNASIGVYESQILNEINLAEEKAVFYNIDGNIYVENEEKTILLYEHEENENVNQMEEKFINLDLKEKQKLVDEGKKHLKAAQNQTKTGKIANIGYTPSYSKTENGIELGIFPYSVNQGNYNICWAACIATIYRYLQNDTTLTAEDVARKMGENYTSSAYSGANEMTIAKAFYTYGLYYRKYNGLIPWNDIVGDINKKRPVFLIGRKYYSDGNSTAHAVLISGYEQSSSSGNKYIKIWDPKSKISSLVKYGEDCRFVSSGMSFIIRQAYK